MATILIVDDVAGVHRDYARGLVGHTLLRALSAKEAREQWKKHGKVIDVVVLDGYLNPSDGESTTEKLAEEIRASGFKGPMVASSSDDGICNRLRHCGCDHIIHKSNLPGLLALVVQTTR